eukprot:7403922-Pyramimonas_sp.AAC.1
MAILAPSRVRVTLAPGRSSAELVPGRVLAAHVRWGIKQGITMQSIYLHDGQSLSDANVEILRQVATYICGGLEHAGG